MNFPLYIVDTRTQRVVVDEAGVFDDLNILPPGVCSTC